MNEMITKTDEEKEPNVTITVTSGSFPMSLFLEWDKDCKERFGNCRWMKMWHDHQIAKNLEIFQSLKEDIRILEIKIESLEKKPKDDKVLTLGKGE